MQDIRTLSLSQLQEALTQEGQKAFRAKQIYEWLWKKSARSFDEMSNLSLDLRKRLKEIFVIHNMQIDTAQHSNDGTIKVAFRLHDGHLVEGVLIPTDTRMTACISSQVGCSLTCSFCATGYMKRARNLSPAEIYDQVVLLNQTAQEHYNTTLANIVLMGMGEPLLNYNNVQEGIEHITSPQGLHMGAKRITLSTAGIAKKIRQLADDDVKCNLALSLHAADDAKRSEIMPINDSNTLEALGDALKYYYQKTKNRVTFEYILFYDFNDSLQDAEALYQFSKKVPSKVNIIEYNPIQEASFVNTKEDRLQDFADYLQDKGLVVVVRRSRGKDIDAACGQLANK